MRLDGQAVGMGGVYVRDEDVNKPQITDCDELCACVCAGGGDNGVKRNTQNVYKNAGPKTRGSRVHVGVCVCVM